MAILAQGSCEFQLDNAAGTPVAIHSEATSVTLTVNNDTTTSQTFGSYWKDSYEGTRGASAALTVEGSDVTAETGAGGLINTWAITASAKPGARSLTVGLPDIATTGSLTYGAEVLFNSVGLVNGVAGSGSPQAINLNMTIDGAITRTVVS